MKRPRRIRAVTPAKVNLGLEITCRRPDGYHELVSVIQAISIYDRFEWTATEQPFEYAGINEAAPEDDLITRSLALAPDISRWTGRLIVEKCIPAAAGLGGGSSDAALALRLAMPGSTPEVIQEYAARTGADVPFFLSSGTALATGTGTSIFPLPTPHLWFVVVTPPLSIPDKTRSLYGGLETGDFSDGTAVRNLAQWLTAGHGLSGPLPNSFARQLLSFPVVRYAYDGLLSVGCRVVSISGAGPTVYAVMESYTQAARVAMRLPSQAGAIRIARSVAARDHPPLCEMARALRGADERS